MQRQFCVIGKTVQVNDLLSLKFVLYSSITVVCTIYYVVWIYPLYAYLGSNSIFGKTVFCYAVV